MNNLLSIIRENILIEHRQEWLDSGVDPDIIDLNLESLEDTSCLLGGEVEYPIEERLDRKVIRFGRQTRPYIGGWWVSGVDPLDDFKRMAWGRFKPDSDTPIRDWKKNKPAKYLSPAGTGTSRATFLEVSLKVWQRVADRAGVPVSGASFWRWVLEKNVPVTLCEGEKKAGCLLSLGYAAIALPGFRSAARRIEGTNNSPGKPILIPEVAAFATPDRVINICFDFETNQKTVQAIRSETQKLCWLLAEAVPKIITLPGPDKGVDDFVIAQGEEAFHDLYLKSHTARAWAGARYSTLTYKPDLTLNQRYLGALEAPDDAKLWAIKSPKGTGKTEALKAIVAGAMERSQRVLLLSHRVQLGQAICDRVGLNYVTELRGSEEGALFGYGLCIDSLHPESQARFEAEDWEDAIVIIDEVEQVVSHLLNANTEVNTHRLSILEQLQQLFLQTIQSQNGKIILLDADLTDVSINFVLRLANAENWVTPWIAVNEWEAKDKRDCYNYPQSRPNEWYAALHQEVDAEKKLFITTQSQKAKSTWSARNIEKDILKRHPTKKILRIDSETVADPSHPAFGCVGRLNETVINYDIVIATPVIETGLSIDVRGHFDSVWGCFWGVSSANSARQALARIRDDCERHIWAANYGIGRIANGATTKYGLRNAQTKVAQAAINRLSAWWEEDEGYKSHEVALGTWAEIACRFNAETLAYRESIIKGLESEGYEIHEVEARADLEAIGFVKQQLESLIETRDETYQEECDAEVAIDLISDKEGEALKKKRSRSAIEQLQYRKWKRHKKYSVPVDENLIRKDNDGWFPRLQLYYFLLIGRQHLEQRDAQLLNASSHKGLTWFPSFNRSHFGVTIALLDFLDVTALMDSERDYKNTDSDLIDFAEKSRANRTSLRDLLGVTIGETHSPIAICNKILKGLGLHLIFARKEGARGSNQRVYRFKEPDDGRFEVFPEWLKRDELTQTHYAVGATFKGNNFIQEAA